MRYFRDELKTEIFIFNLASLRSGELTVALEQFQVECATFLCIVVRIMVNCHSGHLILDYIIKTRHYNITSYHSELYTIYSVGF